MKAVILAGGFGTRITEESHLRPKPMVEIGGKPILWHIMKLYSHHGVNDFVICLGYRGYMIKEYFANYFLHTADITVDLKNNNLEILHKKAEPWRITMIDTGENSMTGGRLRRVRDHLDGTFCLTYGDGLSDVNISGLIDYHKKSGKKATVTAIQPPGRFGVLHVEDTGEVSAFQEKPTVDGAWINGGFFVLEPSVIDYIEGDDTHWELAPMRRLATEGELNAYQHKGFWQAMDTLREKNLLEDMWLRNAAPWKAWT